MHSGENKDLLTTINKTHIADNILKTDFFFVWVKMCDLRLVDCANFFEQLSNGQTYGRSPVWIRTCVRKLKSSENRLPQPSNVHYNDKSIHVSNCYNLSIGILSTDWYFEVFFNFKKALPPSIEYQIKLWNNKTYIVQQCLYEDISKQVI